MEFLSLVVEYLFMFIGLFTALIMLIEIGVFIYKYKHKKYTRKNK